MNKHRTILDIMHHYINNGIDKTLECSLFSIVPDKDKSAVLYLYGTDDCVSSYIIRSNGHSISNHIDSVFPDSVTLWKYNNSTKFDILNFGDGDISIDISSSECMFQYSTLLCTKSVELLKLAQDIVEYDSVIISLYSTEKEQAEPTIESIIEEFNKISPVQYKV